MCFYQNKVNDHSVNQALGEILCPKSARDTVLPFAFWWHATPSGRDDQRTKCEFWRTQMDLPSGTLLMSHAMTPGAAATANKQKVHVHLL